MIFASLFITAIITFLWLNASLFVIIGTKEMRIDDDLMILKTVF